MRKSKPKSASPKHGKKKAVRIKDLPVKNLKGREILGGSATPNPSIKDLENRPNPPGGTNAKPDALNLGL